MVVPTTARLATLSLDRSGCKTVSANKLADSDRRNETVQTTGNGVTAVVVVEGHRRMIVVQEAVGRSSRGRDRKSSTCRGEGVTGGQRKI